MGISLLWWELRHRLRAHDACGLSPCLPAVFLVGLLVPVLLRRLCPVVRLLRRYGLLFALRRKLLTLWRRLRKSLRRL